MHKYLGIIAFTFFSTIVFSQNEDLINWLNPDSPVEDAELLENPTAHQIELAHILQEMISSECIQGEFPAPENLRSEPRFSGRLLKWDAVPGSIAYYMEGSRVGGEIYSIQFFGADLSERFISGNVLNAGITYKWRLRVACRIAPDTVASPFSDWNYFTMPGEPEDDTFPSDTTTLTINHLYPNPASKSITFYCSELEGLDPKAFIYNASGLKVEEIELKIGENKIPVEFYEDGVYIIRATGLNGKNTLKFLKIN